jgi:hypothetical protein
MATTSIDWKGISGQTYTYEIHPIDTSFKGLPGNYIFAKETKPNTWTPVYIGETSNLSERFDDHHKKPCVDRNGATHIHVHVNDAGEAARRAEEQDLIAAYRPPCND